MIIVEKSVTVIPFGHTEQIVVEDNNVPLLLSSLTTTVVETGTGDGVGPNKLSGNTLSV